MASKLELLSGPAVQTTLKEANASIYRYEVNKPGLYIAVGIALAFYAIGGLCWWETQLATPAWIAVFVAVMMTGLGFTAVAAYWHEFATQNVIGVSDDRLFLGGPKKLWAISWELLDRESMGFEQMQMTRLRGGLKMTVAGQPIKLHLFNAIAYLADIEGFIHGVLSHLPREESALTEEE